MAKTVHCVKLGIEAEALPSPPYPGELGQRIFEQVSQPAWDQWVQQMTMMINEYRLSLADVQTRRYLEREMAHFFFGSSAAEAPIAPPQ